MSTIKASANGNGNGGQTVATTDAESALTAALADLKSDLRSLRADIDSIREDGLAVGRSSVRAAQDVATAKVQGVRQDVARTVSTLEEDVAAIASDLSAQVQRNPYTTLGVAVLGGMLLSRLLKKD